MSEYTWQEVRASDSNVVVPSDLHLPQESEPEKLSATFLGLTFPFPVCSGNCVESYVCFQCHTLEKHEELGCITARFRPLWRHWHACMSLRSENAQDRIFASLAHPVIRDVIGIRSTVPEKEEDEVVGLLQLILHKHLRPRDCRYHDVARIYEMLAWFLGCSAPFHFTQLTPLEYLSYVQTRWLERFKQHHSARRTSSSRRKAERFALMTKIEEDDLEDDVNPVDIEGDDVVEDMKEQDALERLERAQYTLDLEALHEAMFREQEWLQCIGNKRTTIMKGILTHLREFVTSLGGVPDARKGMGIKSDNNVEAERNWSVFDAERNMSLQRSYLEFLSGGLGLSFQVIYFFRFAFLLMSMDYCSSRRVVS